MPIRLMHLLVLCIPAELLLRGSEELVSDMMRRLDCGCWSVGYAGALCAGGLLIPLSPTAQGT